LNFRVDASGFVTDSTILRSSGYVSMDDAARSALHRCRFVPALRNGQPVPSWQPVQYVWKLA
jgi:D-alanyl-D-alanine endopeptidase (penicillin-binding protein 7)